MVHLQKTCRIVTSCIVSAGLALVAADGPVSDETAGAPTVGNASEEPSRLSVLPSWLKLGAEFRARVELTRHVDFEPRSQDTYYLSRLRFEVGVQPSSWLRLHLQGQDASAPAFNDRSALEGIANALDVRQAYAEFGGGETGPWALRAGRQELSFGDERLVGADNYWDALGQTFDALRLTYAKPSFRLDWFGAFLLPPRHGRLDRAATGNQLYGFYSSFANGPGGAVVEPYFLWKSSRRLLDEAGRSGHHDVYTWGVRAEGDLPRRFDYNVELALQRGHVLRDSIAAWAGHWEIGYKLREPEDAPRVALEYNFGSGDGDPEDGHRRTFDELYPAGYNGFGMSDPFAWMNSHNLSGYAEWKVSRRWQLSLGYRGFWLATLRDGLYLDPETWLARDPGAPSSHVGNQVSFLATHEFSKRWQLHFGYARFFPGSYLKHSSYDGALSTPFVMWNYRF